MKIDAYLMYVCMYVCIKITKCLNLICNRKHLEFTKLFYILMEIVFSALLLNSTK
jgi:hypothetical protein